MELRRTCADFVDGSTCSTDESGDPYCGFGTECEIDLSNPGDSCEGVSLHYCLLDQPVTVDCVALGFSGCVSDAISTGCR